MERLQGATVGRIWDPSGGWLNERVQFVKLVKGPHVIAV